MAHLLNREHIIPYTPYSLKVVMEGKKCNVAWTSAKHIAVIRPDGIGDIKKIAWKHAHLNIKPILHPLVDFYESVDGVSFSNMITHGYHSNFWYEDNFEVKHLMYRDFQILVSKYADVFGLIKKGLAVDINTFGNATK